jgi:uncharacterized protein YndB with AHSA1/START domain
MNRPDVNSIPSDRRIETSRLLPNPAVKVFQAFRDPAVLAGWWGPDGFTNTFNEFDFREGGAWRFTMHSPEGKDFPNESRFLEIVEPSLIVFDHVCAPRFQTILRFDPSDGGCRIDWCMVFSDSKTREKIASYASDGLEQNLNRLAAKLNEEC